MAVSRRRALLWLAAGLGALGFAGVRWRDRAHATPSASARPAPLSAAQGHAMTRIVILGSGFAALTAIRKLRELRVDAEITVVSPRNELVYLPSLIWLPSGEKTGDDLRIPLAGFFQRMRVRWHPGSVQQVLGCDAELLSINSQEFSVLLEATGAGSSDDARPHLWASSWGPDYPDAHNWVGDVLSCAGENSFRRPCSPVDDLIAEAALESNPDNRLELYYRIEEMFFGAEGEHPIIPLWLEFETVLFKPWVEGPFGTDALFGGDHYDWYNVDQAAQLAARD